MTRCEGRTRFGKFVLTPPHKRRAHLSNCPEGTESCKSDAICVLSRRNANVCAVLEPSKVLWTPQERRRLMSNLCSLTGILSAGTEFCKRGKPRRPMLPQCSPEGVTDPRVSGRFASKPLPALRSFALVPSGIIQIPHHLPLRASEQ